MWKSILAALFVFILLGWSTENGKLVVGLPYETTGQKHWFATVGGTGDCLTWSTACTFRTAVGKCTSTYADVIHVGVGQHELDNLSDATGTTISADHVTVQGITKLWSGASQLLNGDAAADNSLGVYEFTVGASVASQFVPIHLDVANSAIPATSGIWAKTESSTDGEDSLTITISYIEL